MKTLLILTLLTLNACSNFDKQYKSNPEEDPQSNHDTVQIMNMQRQKDISPNAPLFFNY